MWNKENTIRLIGKVTKEYGKEIIAEGSKSVMGIEDHIDRIIAEILGVESEAITAAREWRKIIQRAAILNRIDKVNQILNQEETQTLLQASETHEEIKEIEILTKDKLYNELEANIQSKKTIEVEMEISKENSQTD